MSPLFDTETKGPLIDPLLLLLFGDDCVGKGEGDEDDDEPVLPLPAEEENRGETGRRGTNGALARVRG